jgi:hypothetical protein
MALSVVVDVRLQYKFTWFVSFSSNDFYCMSGFHTLLRAHIPCINKIVVCVMINCHGGGDVFYRPSALVHVSAITRIVGTCDIIV